MFCDKSHLGPAELFWLDRAKFPTLTQGNAEPRLNSNPQGKTGQLRKGKEVSHFLTHLLLLFSDFVNKSSVSPFVFPKLGTIERRWCGLHCKPGRASYDLPGASLLAQQSSSRARSRPESFAPVSKQGKHLWGRPGPGGLRTQAWADSGSIPGELTGVKRADVTTSRASLTEDHSQLTRQYSEEAGKQIKSIN